jgi:hypothetical protein
MDQFPLIEVPSLPRRLDTAALPAIKLAGGVRGGDGPANGVRGEVA